MQHRDINTSHPFSYPRPPPLPISRCLSTHPACPGLAAPRRARSSLRRRSRLMSSAHSLATEPSPNRVAAAVLRRSTRIAAASSTPSLRRKALKLLFSAFATAMVSTAPRYAHARAHACACTGVLRNAHVCIVFMHAKSTHACCVCMPPFTCHFQHCTCVRSIHTHLHTHHMRITGHNAHMHACTWIP